ncbi:heavy-metal-associated domain-containing protein [Streptococcus catagoni]|uniref:heavy-metal-associated domain-containing protein n=1 Tax=Streptococcus catagoni TaxID=2654874 RepID=UPI00140B88A0|nr:heavy metal-associated domain-containing protein [Streptococcus catagoni]
MENKYEIKGMSCQACAEKVRKKLASVRGVESVRVDLDKEEALISGKPLTFLLKWALRGTAYSIKKD